jgi:hypothetical protein
MNVKYDFKPGGVEVEQGMGEQISRGAGDQVRHQGAVPEFFHIAAGVVVDHNRIASFANLDAGVRIGYCAAARQVQQQRVALHREAVTFADG